MRQTSSAANAFTPILTERQRLMMLQFPYSIKSPDEMGGNGCLAVVFLANGEKNRPPAGIEPGDETPPRALEGGK